MLPIERRDRQGFTPNAWDGNAGAVECALMQEVNSMNK
jgi:hypothetical protein